HYIGARDEDARPDVTTEKCSEGQTCCQGSGCVKLRTFLGSCGICGIGCRPGEACVDGGCQCDGGTGCGDGLNCCGPPGAKQCVDAANSLCDCGGVVCQQGQDCCDDGMGGEKCANLQTDSL